MSTSLASPRARAAADLLELLQEAKYGDRNNALTELARKLYAEGTDRDTVLRNLHAANLWACQPMLAGAEVERIAASTAPNTL